MADIVTDVLSHMFGSSATLDLPCAACGFAKHCHGKHSQICPVLVRGMLHQYQPEVQNA